MNDQKFSTMSNGIMEQSEQLTMKTKRAFKKFINISLIILCLFLIGSFDFLNFRFDFSTIKTTAFWLHLLLRAVLLILLYNTGLNIFMDKELSTNQTLLAYKKEYQEKNKLKDIDFEEFIENVLNPKLKRQAYIKRIQSRIYKLDRRAKDTDKLLFNSVLPEKQDMKLHNKYCIKKQKLLDLMSDEFIERELPNIKVSYSRIEPSIFSTDVYGNIVADEYKVKSEIGKARTRKTANSLLMMIVGSLFISSIFLDPDFIEMFQNINMIINCIIKLIMDILFAANQLLRGMLDTPAIVSQEYTIVFANRIKILDLYLDYAANKPKSASYKILNYINKTEEA